MVDTADSSHGNGELAFTIQKALNKVIKNLPVINSLIKKFPVIGQIAKGLNLGTELSEAQESTSNYLAAREEALKDGKITSAEQKSLNGLQERMITDVTDAVSSLPGIGLTAAIAGDVAALHKAVREYNNTSTCSIKDTTDCTVARKEFYQNQINAQPTPSRRGGASSVPVR
jgi:hypothetical protein